MLIVVRREGSTVRILTGRRSARHAFMPGLTVFPGGRVDRADYAARPDDALDPAVERRLLARLSGRRSASRARAIAAAGLRETAEETGLLVGRPGAGAASRAPGWAVFSRNGIVPALAPLRLVARAITPPGLVRRFDARFFTVPEEAVATRVAPLNDELHDLQWLSLEEARATRMAAITRRIVDVLEDRLARDPYLQADEAVPFYYTRGDRIICERI